MQSLFSQTIHQVVYERAIRGQYIARCEHDNAVHTTTGHTTQVDTHHYTGFDENTQVGDILVCVETEWIAVYHWPAMVEFDVSEHTAHNQLVHGLYLLNQCPQGCAQLCSCMKHATHRA